MTLKAKADRITERVPIGKTRSAPVPVGNTRWMMGALLGVGVVVNNLDRLNLALASTAMAHSLHLSNKELGILLSSFTWTYALSQLPAGLILDRIGVRWVQRIATLIWTISCILTATASGPRCWRTRLRATRNCNSSLSGSSSAARWKLEKDADSSFCHSKAKPVL